MGTFNPNAFRDKLGGLNSTQASIETLSNWCQFFRKSAPAVVAAWDAEYMKAPPPRRLLMLYLANDILQNSRRKGPEFVVEFYKIIPRSLRHSLRHFDEGTRNRVNRLISVWDERKVFGHTGTRTLKDLLAEVETPTKRGLSARTGGPSAAEGPFGGPPTPNGATGGVSIPRELRPLAGAFSSAAAAGATSSALVDSCSAVLQRGLLESGSAEEVQRAADVLQDYQNALAAESQVVGATRAALLSLFAQQEEAAQKVTEQQVLAAWQLQACRTRLAALTGAPQPAAPSAGAPSAQALSEAAPAAADSAVGSSGGALAMPPPLPAAVAPPLPAMSGPGGATPPPLPVSMAGGSAAPEQLPMTTAAVTGSTWQQPAAGQQEAGSSLAPPLPDVDMVVETLPEQQQQLQPPLPGPSSGGNDDEAAAAAAALVAQLSAANDSKALLEALAALPQDQQREISLSFLSSGAVGGLPAAGGAGGEGGEEEEYNPEDPGF